MSWDYEFQAELATVGSFSDAVRLFSKRPGKLGEVRSPRLMSYSLVSKKMGLRSRSNVREVAEGLKKPSTAFLHSFCEAMKMTAAWKSFFHALHAAEADKPGGRELLKAARARISKQLKKKIHSGPSKSLLHSPAIPLVFAALGSVESGASIRNIVEKTGLAQPEAEKIVAELVRAGAAREENGIVYPLDLHLVLEIVGADEFFRRDTLNSLSIAKGRLSLPKNSDYFFSSTLSVLKRDLPKLQDRLDLLLKEYVSEAESADGDQIVNLTAFVIPANLNG